MQMREKLFLYSDNLDLMYSLRCLAIVCTELGLFEEALVNNEKIYKIRTEHETSPEKKAEALYEVAESLYYLGRYEEAKVKYEEVYGMKDSVGSINYCITYSLNALVIICEQLDDLQGAKYYQDLYSQTVK